MCRRFDAHFTIGSSLRGQFQSPAPQSTPRVCLSPTSLPSVSTPEDIHSTFSASELIQLADVIIIIPAFHTISRLSCYLRSNVLSAVTLIIYSFDDYMLHVNFIYFALCIDSYYILKTARISYFLSVVLCDTVINILYYNYNW